MRATVAFIAFYLLLPQLWVASSWSVNRRLDLLTTETRTLDTIRGCRPLERRIQPRTSSSLCAVDDELFTSEMASEDKMDSTVGLNQAEQIAPSSSSVLACTALVAGTTVGAGIIALPAKTLEAGFVPSVALLVGGWIYMAFTGLLIAEININTICILDAEEAASISIPTMVRETLPAQAEVLATVAFLFLHYALITAYILQGGSLLLETLQQSQVLDNMAIDPTFGAPIFGLGLGGALYFLRQDQMEQLNNILVAGVVVAFCVLVGIGAGSVQPSLLERANYGALVDAVPLMPVVFVFQTVVPTICTLLECDLPKIQASILLGTGLPLLMFATWSAVILGTVSPESASGLVDPLEALRTSGSTLGTTVQVFSILAVATSFLGFAYGLLDFLADLFGWESFSGGAGASRHQQRSINVTPTDDGAKDWLSKSPVALSLLFNKKQILENKQLFLLAIALIPPMGIALWDPTIFLGTLDNAGVYGILVLFGILPAAMALAQRQNNKDDMAVAIPGANQASLLVVFGVAFCVIGLESWEKLKNAGLFVGALSS